MVKWGVGGLVCTRLASFQHSTSVQRLVQSKSAQLAAPMSRLSNQQDAKRQLGVRRPGLVYSDGVQGWRDEATYTLIGNQPNETLARCEANTASVQRRGKWQSTRPTAQISRLDCQQDTKRHIGVRKYGLLCSYADNSRFISTQREVCKDEATR